MNEELEVMKAVLEQSDQIVAICRKGGHSLIFSHAAEKVFGRPRFIALQEDDSQRYGLFYPESEELIPTGDLPLARALRGETVRDVRVVVRRPGQPEYLLSLNAGPLRDRTGNYYGGVLVGSILDERSLGGRTPEEHIRNGRARDGRAQNQDSIPAGAAAHHLDGATGVPKAVVVTMKSKDRQKQSR